MASVCKKVVSAARIFPTPSLFPAVHVCLTGVMNQNPGTTALKGTIA